VLTQFDRLMIQLREGAMNVTPLLSYRLF